MSSSNNVYVASASDGDARLAAMNNVEEYQTASGRRLKKKFSLKNVLKDDTLVAARMHATDTSAIVVKDGASSRETTAAAAAANDYQADDDANAAACGMMEDISSNLTIMEGGSLGAAVFGIIKGTVGPAILYLPRGFQVSGWAIAIPSMLIATVLYIYNAHRLLECWNVERQRDAEKQQEGSDIDAQDVEGNVTTTTDATTHSNHTRVLLTYPELAKRTWGDGSILVEVAIAALQFGVCLTYLIFVPQNLIESVNALFGWNIPKLYFLIAMVIVEIPLSWIRDIRKLTPTNVVATALIVYGLFFVLVLAIYHGMGGGDGDPVFVDNLKALPVVTENWFLFVGTSFFMMEGSITLLVPLQESVIQEEDKKKFAGMNQRVTYMIVIFYIFFSMICCAAFGDTIQTALTASLEEGMLATSIQLAYSLAVILTFPLQAFPAMEVLKKQVLGPEPSIIMDHDDATASESTTTTTTYKTYYRNRNILAALVICALGVLAYCAIDYLGHVVSILGSLFGIPLALVFPPLMHNKLLESSSSDTMKWMNKGVLVIGILAMIAASVATLLTWDDVGPEGR